jgi:hypothetical protein
MSASLDFAGVLEVYLETLDRLPNELVTVGLVLLFFTCLSWVVLTVALVEDLRAEVQAGNNPLQQALERLPFGNSIGVVEGGARCSAKSGRNRFQNNDLERTFRIAEGQ